MYFFFNILVYNYFRTWFNHNEIFSHIISKDRMFLFFCFHFGLVTDSMQIISGNEKRKDFSPILEGIFVRRTCICAQPSPKGLLSPSPPSYLFLSQSKMSRGSWSIPTQVVAFLENFTRLTQSGFEGFRFRQMKWRLMTPHKGDEFYFS